MNSQFQVSSFKLLTKKIIVLIATGFGLGCSPVASGTAGTIPGILISIGLSSCGLIPQIMIAALLVLLAVPLCDVAEKHFGTKDDHRIVADEFLTFPICMIGLPPTAWMLSMAFLTNRLMDISKPPPARKIQAWPGGIGIVADDVISSLYSLVANHLIYLCVMYWL